MEKIYRDREKEVIDREKDKQTDRAKKKGVKRDIFYLSLGWVGTH